MDEDFVFNLAIEKYGAYAQSLMLMEARFEKHTAQANLFLMEQDSLF